MHEGHRSRFSAKLLDGSTFYDHETVELMLYNACPRKDLNAVSHRLLEAFGSIGGVLSASVDDLMKIEGVGRNIAEYIRVLGMCMELAGGSYSFGTLNNTYTFLNLIASRPHAEGESLELYVLDKDDRVRRISAFSVDGKYESEALALLTASHAYGVFVAHIRRGNSFPREEDEKILNGLFSLCRTCAVRLYDYCVSGDDGVYSYFMHGELSGDRI